MLKIAVNHLSEVCTQAKSALNSGTSGLGLGLVF